MDIQGMGKNIIGKLEDNAMLLTVLGATYARFAEGGADGLGGMITQFTTFSSTQGVISELMADVGMKAGGNTAQQTLVWKLWQSPHLYTQLIKVGIGIWAVGKLGVIPAHYGSLGMKVLKGAVIAALISPGSGNTQRTPQNIVQNSVSNLGNQSTLNAFNNVYG